MTAKDELEGQRSCRSGLIEREMEKTKRTRLMPVALGLFLQGIANNRRAADLPDLGREIVSLALAHAHAAKAFIRNAKRCIGIRFNAKIMRIFL